MDKNQLIKDKMRRILNEIVGTYIEKHKLLFDDRLSTFVE